MSKIGIFGAAATAFTISAGAAAADSIQYDNCTLIIGNKGPWMYSLTESSTDRDCCGHDNYSRSRIESWVRAAGLSGAFWLPKQRNNAGCPSNSGGTGDGNISPGGGVLGDGDVDGPTTPLNYRPDFEEVLEDLGIRHLHM